MMISFKKSALAFVAMTTVATVTVACGSKKSSNNPTGTTVTKGDGSAANLACLGMPHTASTGSSITMSLHSVAQTVSGLPTLPGTDIARLNPATGTTSGAAVTTDLNGFAAVGVTDLVRVAFKASHAPTSATYVDTYQFNTLTPAASTTTANAYTIRVIDSTTYSAFIGLIGLSAADVAGKTQVAGSVNDCDGDPLKHVSVKTINRCQGHTSLPCVAYFNGAAPSPSATETDASGQFVVAGVAPGSTYTITLEGIPTDGAAAVDLGTLTVYGQPDAVALGATDPYSN